jgi:primosomal protein N' (replication factor Y)
VLDYHSALAAGARGRCWNAAADGRARIVVGTRSAVWLPFARLGLIVIDEEHDGAYKQMDGFRYSARDVAILRARRLGIPALLGSATPALETQQGIASGRYRHLQMTRRVHDAAPPPPRILDVRRLALEHGLSAPLLARAAEHLDRGSQVLFFLNRRGYAPLLLCHVCGWNAPCAQCDAHLTLHRTRGLLICHHCGFRQSVPRQCPDCGHARLLPVGEGTERVEQALLQHFPGRRVLRLDADRAADASQRAALLDDIHAGRAQILVGTQMLAKGHDLPDLGLAVLVNADQGLYGTDFRAPERMAQLIVQAAGRAGRAGRPGEVLLQTWHPEHPLLQSLLRGGYAEAARLLLAERRAGGWPPYASLALLSASAHDSGRAQAFLNQARGLDWPAAVEVLGPAPAALPRRAGRWRWQLLLRAGERRLLHAALRRALPVLRQSPAAKQVRWQVDVDPQRLD